MPCGCLVTGDENCRFCRPATEANSQCSDGLHRKLELGEKIQAGDQWLNHDWEVGGPWYTVKEGNKNIGVKYEAHFREMRRAV